MLTHVNLLVQLTVCIFPGRHLNGQPFRYYSPDASFSYIGFLSFVSLSSLSSPHQCSCPNWPETVWKQENHVQRCFCTKELSCSNMSLVWPFCTPLPCLQSHVPFLVLVASFVENIYVQYVVWPSKGQLVTLSPLGVRACACAWAYAWICLLSYVCMTHLCLTGNHTAAGSEPKEKGGKNNK